jgi:D-glycero-alpha-D-manno-heptose-7-phosphate kinase
MIISRTPFRISFFGGGTDFPAWYKENDGAVLATTINKYCYISCRYLPPFFEHKSRIIWTKIECVKDISEIKHPSVRACLQFMKINKGIEIHHDGDLPARTGMGSSSAFTVGLLHSLYALKGIKPTKRQLVLNAIYLEQEIMRESVGSQDQVLAAFGGFNLIKFGGNNHFSVKPITISPQRLEFFQSHLMLFFTGFSRNSSLIGAELVKRFSHNKKEIKIMHQMVNAALEMLNSNSDLSEFGRLLHENWQLKRCLSCKISIPLVDEIYSVAIKAGALGGKLLGAGGGGFILIYAKPEAQLKIKEKLKKFLYVPFKFGHLGSQIIFYNHNSSLVNP